MRECRSGSCLRLPGQRAAGSDSPSFSARQIPRERTLLPPRTHLLAVALKARRSNPRDAHQGLWQFASRNLARRSHSRVPPHPSICSLVPPFRPISPGSTEPACGERGCSGQLFDDRKAPQPFTETGMAWPRNPIYVLFLLALFRAGLITVAAHEKFLALSKGRQDSVGHSLAGAGL